MVRTIHAPYRFRYPRLFRMAQFVAILSQGETEALFRDYHDGLPFSGEAVNHFGGTHAVIRSAVQKRTNYGLRTFLGGYDGWTK